MLLPPDLRDWLSDDHLRWFVIDAVTELDLEPFYASYRSGGHGAATHDPKIPAENSSPPHRGQARPRRRLPPRPL